LPRPLFWGKCIGTCYFKPHSACNCVVILSVHSVTKECECLIVLVVWYPVDVSEVWWGNRFFSTRYPSESYSRYDTNVLIFIMVKLVLNLNYHQWHWHCCYVMFVCLQNAMLCQDYLDLKVLCLPFMVSSTCLFFIAWAFHFKLL
jgi:hypothetical protein